MKLKHYQEKVVTALKNYLGALADERSEFEDVLAYKPNYARHFDFPREAWQKATGR